MHRKNKISIYKTKTRPILCYGCETWTMTRKTQGMLNAFERKNLRQIYRPKQVEGGG
jgi:hypothetical protein